MRNLMMILGLLSLIALSPTARGEDVDEFPLVACVPGQCAFMYDLPMAADAQPGGFVKESPAPANTPLGTVEITGSPGPDQPFTASAFRCETDSLGHLLQYGCVLQKANLPLNKKVALPQGHYIFIYAGTQSSDIEVKAGSLATSPLAALAIPQTFRQGIAWGEINRVSVTRDLTSGREQAKSLDGFFAFSDNRVVLQNQALPDPQSLATDTVKFPSSDSVMLTDRQMKSRVETDIPLTYSNAVSELSGPSGSKVIAVFAGDYQLTYESDRTGIYLSKSVSTR